MTPGAGLASWTPLVALAAVFAVIVAVLAVAGGWRRGARAGGVWGLLHAIPDELEAATGIPGWAAGMIGTAAFGLLMAGIGFYNDVAWHVGLGRDKNLFTAPHTMIVLGLGFIALAAAVGIAFATATRVDAPLRLGALRVPWSSVPLGLLGLCALLGFPLDDFWHKQYGIDVTMWSPTHLLMICGASFSLIAAWLALAEAGVPFRPAANAPLAHRAWARIAHLVAAWFVLAGLTSVLGEFRFGVPQFQQLYHPVLLCLASAFAFVAIRLVLGRGWTLVVALATFLPEALHIGSTSGSNGFVPTRSPGLFLTSAIAVELAAALVGTRRRGRFAVVAGLGVATIGLAGEYVWNRGAPQPWTSALFPDALVVGALVAVGAAVLAAAYGGAVARQPGRIARRWIGTATLAVVAGLLLPLPRHTGAVNAALEVERTGDVATVTVHLVPADAADGARWFQTVAWQGGGLVVAGMREVEPGTWVSDRPVPVTGSWKTVVRLHRGAELMSLPVYFPADSEIGADEIPAVDRALAFGPEQQYLLREVKDGPRWFSLVAYAVIGGISVLWAASFALAASRIPARPVLRAGARPSGPPTPRERVSAR